MCERPVKGAGGDRRKRAEARWKPGPRFRYTGNRVPDGDVCPGGIPET